jgi:hypothetical protein
LPTISGLGGFFGAEPLIFTERFFIGVSLHCYVV